MSNRSQEFMQDTGCAQRLKEAREKNGLTQKEVAEKIGAHLNTVYLWERGQICPQLYFIDALADLYGVSIEWLCGRE